MLFRTWVAASFLLPPNILANAASLAT
eukprot:COSAG01_NODE_24958_length_760_cov_1.614221_1_plen_26_part_10